MQTFVQIFVHIMHCIVESFQFTALCIHDLAENPRTTVNLDMDEPYSFRKNSDRPHTTTGQEVITQKLVTSSRSQLPATARLRRSLTSTNR